MHKAVGFFTIVKTIRSWAGHFDGESLSLKQGMCGVNL